jgi:hypothetical protein
MKKIAFIILTLLCLASCNVQKPLYSWYNYNTASYDYLKNADEKSLQEIVKTYQKIIEKQEGSRKTVPPGIYADYGFLLLQTNNEEDGRTMLMQEIALYPESEIFINRILKMIEK